MTGWDASNIGLAVLGTILTAAGGTLIVMAVGELIRLTRDRRDG